MIFLTEFLEQYINYTIVLNVNDILKLIDVVDSNKIIKPISDLNEPIITWDNIIFPKFYLNTTYLQIFFLKTFDSGFSISKILLFVNIIFVKIIFLKITSTTFWLIPATLLFVGALTALFMISPSEQNKKIWVRAGVFLFLVILYQGALLYIFVDFLQAGYLLKVGPSGALNLPFNMNLTKLIVVFIIFITLLLTLLFYMHYYKKILFLIKPEFCAILLFLGFGSTMIFLQNDLFSLFLYFEIISFCIYGILFLHKWTNVQLHALIWYVLFSLWVSTCYIIGIAFYLVSSNYTTALLYCSNKIETIQLFNTLGSITFDYLIVQEFEILLALTFILIYFLFKLGAGPFYTWTIEVYNSCSTGALLSVSLVPKLIYFPVLFFLLYYNFLELLSYWSTILVGVGVLTTAIGSFGIITTDKLKEIYAWSSIVHTGNLLIITSSVSSVTLTFLIFYLLSYYLISFAFIVILTSLQNWFTGRFIKTVTELNSINMLNSTFLIITIIILASAAGFTPFLSFFMKFSLLTLVTANYGVALALVTALLNIIASVAYLKMLRNIIGFNVNHYNIKSNIVKLNFTELNQSYWLAWLTNLIAITIIFAFIYYKDFIDLFSFYTIPFFMGEERLGVWWLHF